MPLAGHHHRLHTRALEFSLLREHFLVALHYLMKLGIGRRMPRLPHVLGVRKSRKTTMVGGDWKAMTTVAGAADHRRACTSESRIC